MASWSPIHSTGTASVASGGTTVTGVGTAFNVAGIRAGDLFANASLSAMSMITADPTTPNGLSIEAWPGSSLSPGSPYKIIRLPDADRIIEANAQLMQNLVPNLTALGGLSGAANKMPYFSGAGAMSLADLTPAARAILALAGSAGARVPVVTAAGAAALRDIVGTVSHSGGVPTGAIVEKGSNANGEYYRFAGGLQICVHALIEAPDISLPTGALFRSSLISWSFPAQFSTVLSFGGFPYTATGARPWITGGGGTGTNITNSSVGFSLAAPISVGATEWNLFAIGRWHP